MRPFANAVCRPVWQITLSWHARMSPGVYQQRADNWWVWCFSQYVHLPENVNILRVGGLRDEGTWCGAFQSMFIFQKKPSILRVGVLHDEGTWCGLKFSPHHHRCNGASCDGALMSLLACPRVYATIDSVLQQY